MSHLSLRSRGLIVLVIGSIIALCVLLVVKQMSKESAGDSRKTGSGGVTLRHVEYRFSLQNDSNRVAEKAEFWTYGPVQVTAMQECSRLQANHPYELIVDAQGNQVLHFTFQNIPPFATKLIHIQADVELLSAPRTMQAGGSNEFVTRADRIESDSPEILQLAKKLKGRNAFDTAQNTFMWVSENIRYAGYDAVDRGALYALRNKQGDCTEFMSLFVALCRANAIPARGIGGYLCTGDMILKAGDYHNWAEFYENGTWNLVDPQKRAFRDRGEHYVAMRIISRSSVTPMGDWHRFRSAGERLKVSMEP
jgi:transglutaminase-like putative cysteine protease